MAARTDERDMSAFCPDGCPDGEAGPCVVGHPCALHPVNECSDEPLFPVQLEPHLEPGEPVLVRAIWNELIPATVLRVVGATVWVEFSGGSKERHQVMVTSVERVPTA